MPSCVTTLTKNTIQRIYCVSPLKDALQDARVGKTSIREPHGDERMQLGPQITSSHLSRQTRKHRHNRTDGRIYCLFSHFLLNTFSMYISNIISVPSFPSGSPLSHHHTPCLHEGAFPPRDLPTPPSHCSLPLPFYLTSVSHRSGRAL